MKFFTIFIALTASSAIAQDTLKVTCGQDAIIVGYSKQAAREAHYPMSSFHFNDASCTLDYEEDGYYLKRISPLSSCGTDVMTNDTHAIFVNAVSTIVEGISLLFPQPENQVLINIAYGCTYEIDLRLTAAFIPNLTVMHSNFDMQIPPIDASSSSSFVPDSTKIGFFQAAMGIYKTAAYGEVYTSDAPIFQPEDTVFLRVAMVGDASSDLFILLRSCWATVDENPDGEPYYDLIQDSCPVKGAVEDTVRISQNGVGHQALWQTGVFKFFGYFEEYKTTWIHCDITICVQQACPADCNDGESRKRSIRNRHRIDEKVHILTAGPINVHK